MIFKFRGLTPRVDFYFGGGVGLWLPNYKVPPTPEDARACAEFVIDCALRLQEGGGEFIPPEQPRGKTSVLQVWATGEISRRSDTPDKKASEGQTEKPIGGV